MTKAQLHEKYLGALRLACSWPCKTLVGDCRSLKVYCKACTEFKEVTEKYPVEYFDKDGDQPGT